MTHTKTDDRQALMDGIKRVRVAMMTTHGSGGLHTRPMYSHEVDGEEGFWFFTSARSGKVDEIGRDGRVSLAYADPSRNFYAAVTGQAQIVRDRAEIHRLWSEGLRAWFPNGKDDPDIVLLRVDPDRGEYWDGPASFLINLYGTIKARVTGRPPTELTENKIVNL